MELELNKTHLTGCRTVLDTTVFQEETLETIVPDACPDILRLIETRGELLLKGKTASDGRAALSGTARLTVLYLPEGGAGPCHLEVSIPFQMMIEESSVHTGCQITAALRMASADTRIMNPRKIVTRVEIAAHVKAFTPCADALCTGISAEQGVVEQLLETHQPCCVAAVQEKRFSFQEELTIPAGRPSAEKILASRAQPVCLEFRIIGNKLIFKGEVPVRLLYSAQGGELNTADFSLPISQIMEVTGVGESASARMELSLTGAEFVLGGDGRTVSASLSILAQAEIWEERSVTVLTDAYCTGGTLRTECAPYEYQIHRGDGTGRQAVREVIETGMQIRSVIDAYCSLGRMEQSREGDALRLTAQVTAAALCVTEDGEYCAVSRGCQVCCTVEAQQGSECRFVGRCGEVIAAPAADGVEVRFTLEFPYDLLQGASVGVIRDAALQDGGEEDAPRPSLVLRVMEDGERLWDVAKRYGTTVDDIVRVNELESGQPECGALLLIPRKR